MIGRVGDDALGMELRAALVRDGIAVEHLHCVTGVASGVAGVIVDQHGENSIVVAAGANACLSAEKIHALGEVIAASDLLVCQLETPLEAVREAISIAAAAGVTVVFNPAPVQQAVLEDGLLEKVDYLVVNETEAQELSGIEVHDFHSAQQAAAWLRRTGAHAVLLTMGANGVWLDGSDGGTLLPAIPVRALDTTAAGDTFIGSFAVGLGQGAGALAAARRACHAAALAVTRPGAQCSIPLRAEVDMFIRGILDGQGRGA